MKKKPTAGIILAAGESKRFGQPKQLVKLKGKYLIEWVLDAALDSHLEQVILVLGHAHRQIVQKLGTKVRQPRFEVVVNREYKEGQSRSLQMGLLAARNKFPSVMFILGDQPLVDTETIDLLLNNFRFSNKDICLPVYRGKRGNPVIFSRKFYHHFLSITGDIGAREIVKNHPADVLEVEVENPRCVIDIDTENDLRDLQLILPDLF
jgi:molybdenum cofactor cytidylyltransferase